MLSQFMTLKKMDSLVFEKATLQYLVFNIIYETVFDQKNLNITQPKYSQNFSTFREGNQSNNSYK